MHAPFVATGTSKGMSRRRLLWVHALRLVTHTRDRFRDYAFIVAVGLITTFLVIVVNFVADVLAGVADPRFRLN